MGFLIEEEMVGLRLPDNAQPCWHYVLGPVDAGGVVEFAVGTSVLAAPCCPP